MHPHTHTHGYCLYMFQNYSITTCTPASVLILINGMAICYQVNFYKRHCYQMNFNDCNFLYVFMNITLSS